MFFPFSVFIEQSFRLVSTEGKRTCLSKNFTRAFRRLAKIVQQANRQQANTLMFSSYLQS